MPFISPRTTGLAIKKKFASLGNVNVSPSARADVAVTPRGLGRMIVKAADVLGVNGVGLGASARNDIAVGDLAALERVLNRAKEILERNVEVQPLSPGRNNLAGATVGGRYAVFAGGTTPVRSDAVDAYSASLVRTVPEKLSYAREMGVYGAAPVGDYILLTSGYARGVFEAYNSSLVRTVLAEATPVGTYVLGSVGSYAVAVGPNITPANSVYSYNESLSRNYMGLISHTMITDDATALSMRGFVLFAGYRNSLDVDVFNEALARVPVDGLSRTAPSAMCASVGDYGFIAGGTNSNPYNASVDVYDTALVRSTVDPLTQGRYDGVGVSVGDWVLIAGGNRSSANATEVVDAYNSALVKRPITYMSQPRVFAAGASVGNYAIVAGGSPVSSLASLDIYDKDLNHRHSA